MVHQNSNKNRLGFTLIELMVVIVIIGILATVALPKMFGMSAKARASEVGPAVSGWEKAQAAYMIETNNGGTFTAIGYSDPSTESKSFSYFTIASKTSLGASFTASATASLGECAPGVNAVWVSKMQTLSNGVSSRINAPSPNCSILTPSF